MTRQALLRYVAYPTAIIFPVAMAIDAFHEAWGPLELVAAMGEAFAALLLTAVLQIGICLSPRAVGRSFWRKLLVIALVLIGAAFIALMLGPGITRFHIWTRSQDWPILAAAYLVTLMALAAHLLVLVTLILPNKGHPADVLMPSHSRTLRSGSEG